MADNPYSPYVDRTGGSTAWGSNPTNKRGPQNFPPLPTFKPYAAVAASAPGLASIVARLRTNPQTAAAGAGAGSGGAGRGADSSGMSVQGIQGIQGIPTTGSLSDSLAVAPPVDDTPVSPDSPDVAPPPDTGTPPPAGGQYGGGSAIAAVNRLRDFGGYGSIGHKRGPQY